MPSSNVTALRSSEIMPYHVSVYIQNGDGSVRRVYYKALGAVDTVYSYWYLAANDLGLAWVAQIYHEGVELRDEELDCLSSDLQKLEDHWVTTGAGEGLQIPSLILGADGVRRQTFVWLHEHLRARLGFVREAIHIAKKSGGVVEIS